MLVKKGALSLKVTRNSGITSNEIRKPERPSVIKYKPICLTKVEKYVNERVVSRRLYMILMDSHNVAPAKTSRLR